MPQRMGRRSFHVFAWIFLAGVGNTSLAQIRPHVVSPMPNALEKALTPEEFNHLLSFLLEATEPLKPAPDQ